MAKTGSEGRVHLGVGLDTARYGHHVTILREDRQLATKPFYFAESRAGYENLENTFRQLQQRLGRVRFHIRIDAAGQYALNLERFLRALPMDKTISVGEPKRNKDYRSAHFPKRKADAVDSHACARFAVVERPEPTPDVPGEVEQLREICSALEAHAKHTVRLVNQLHNRLSRVFPELALLASDLSANWVVRLLQKYPTPQRIAAARSSSLSAIPYLSPSKAEQLQQAARQTTAGLQGVGIEEVIRQLVREIQLAKQAEKRLKKALQQAYDALPPSPHVQLTSISGIGKQTAAALVAKMVSIDRFETPQSVVNFFGVFPEERTSGVNKQGNPLTQRTQRMSQKGNDLVRRLLYMAAQSALRANPAIRALYARQKAAGKRGDVALGHCMRKLLHLVFAVWKSDRPFDPQHHPWERKPAVAEKRPSEGAQEKAAGRKEQSSPRQAVTTATANVETGSGSVNEIPDKPASPACNSQGRAVDFADLRRQVTIEQALRPLGFLDRMRGGRVQRRGPCPIHNSIDDRRRCFSVNLQKNVFRCFHPPCSAQGNVLDLWAAAHKLPLREAALHLAETFHLDKPNREDGTR